MHCVWSRWPAWSGSSCDRLQCTVPGSTSPTLSGISPTLSGISPAAIIAYFSGTCKPRRRFPPPFSAAFRLSLPQPYRPFCRWPMPPISVGGFRQPSSQRRFCCWLPLLFPSADPSRLRRRPIGIFAGFLSAGLYQEPPPRFSPVPLGQRGCYGSCPAGGCPTFGAACAFYLLSMVSLHTKTSFLTKPHGSKLSLSSFYGLSHGTGQPLL